MLRSVLHRSFLSRNPSFFGLRALCSAGNAGKGKSQSCYRSSSLLLLSVSTRRTVISSNYSSSSSSSSSSTSAAAVMAAASSSSDDTFSAREWKDGEAHEVLPKVFLGSMEAAKDKESLKAHGVTHILTVNGKDPAFKDDFEYKVINFGGDNGPLTPHLSESVSFVESGVEKGGVLIHCTHGTGRSASVAIAAAMKASGKDTAAGVGGFAEAFRLVKSRRPGTDPPMPFQQELGEWESSHSA